MLKLLKVFIDKVLNFQVVSQQHTMLPVEVEIQSETTTIESVTSGRPWATYPGYPQDLEGSPEMTQNLIRLIASNDDVNVELAFQMLKGLKHPVVKDIPVNAAIEKKKLWLKISYDQITNDTYNRWSSRFDLSHLHLTKLPPTIGSLLSVSRHSTSMNLSYNSLEELPYEFFYYKNRHVASSLQSISLTNNRFRYFPDALLKQTSLTEIDLSNNRLSALPRKLQDLRYLTQLFAGFNQLTQLPDTIGDVKELRILALQHNFLRSLPENIGELRFLKNLNLSHNNLKALPNGFGKLQSLRVLNLYINQLEQWPDVFNEIANLREINLSFNQIKKLNLSKLPYLQRLFVVNNQLEELEIEIGSLLRLEKIHLHSNQLKGLPDTIGELKKLKELRLYNNLLESIPDSIGNLENLKFLSLNKNQLTSLPDSIQKLKKLRELDLADNLFSEEEQSKIKSLLPRTLIRF